MNWPEFVCFQSEGGDHHAGAGTVKPPGNGYQYAMPTAFKESFMREREPTL